MTGKMLTWHPHLPVFLCFVLMILVVVWTVAVYRRMLTRLPVWKARLLIAPRIGILLLLLLAFLNPVRNSTHAARTGSSLLALIDISSSMDVRDDGIRTRFSSALEAIETLRSKLPRSFSISTMAFDTSLRAIESHQLDDSPQEAPVRGTDLAACLLELSERADLSAHSAVILLTDGGDETVDTASLPSIPMNVIGLGADITKWNDVRISDVIYPPSVEKDVDFEISVDLAAQVADAALSRLLPEMMTSLERDIDGSWQDKAGRRSDLSNKRTRVTFKTSSSTPGLQRYRVTLTALPGELSYLNNERIFNIEVQKKAVHVLFFTRTIGLSMKMIRSELAADPGVTFTALYRTIGERFVIQGERLPGDESLTAGFPASSSVLRLFDCIILGSFPSHEWNDQQVSALMEYVEQGGAVIFLGGDKSFNAGGYANTRFADLFPWVLTGGHRDMRRGTFPVSIPLASENHPILSGVAEQLSSFGAPIVESLNMPGPLKPGATALMNAQVADRTACMIAVHQFGKGTVLGIGSNTFWKWAKRSPELRNAFGLFWRQAVRNISGALEGGRFMAVKWDKDTYRPGERAVAEIRMEGDIDSGELGIVASMTHAGDTTQLAVEPIQGQPDTFAVGTVFKRRGTYRIEITASTGDTVLESYEKNFAVAPFLGEGTQLAADIAFLTSLAKKGGGKFVPVDHVDELVDHIVQTHFTKTIISQQSMIYDTIHFAVIFLLFVVLELAIRRKLNLF